MVSSLYSRTTRSAPGSFSLAPGVGLAALAALATLACAPADAPTRVRAASTTSLYDTGLLDRLVPAFEEAHPGFRLQVIAVGTGEALALGERGDADVLVVHAPEREEEFVEAEFGLRRSTFMRNDFVLAGPADDPAGVAEAGHVSDALRRIASSGAGDRAEFVSRGDDSGTHIRERMLWDDAGVEPGGDWYLEVGQGMGATLQFAGERAAYLLTDRATLNVLRKHGVGLDELYAGDETLVNVYSIVPVRLRTADSDSADGASLAPASAGALAFERWMLGEEAAVIIREFGTEEYGQPLFTLTPR